MYLRITHFGHYIPWIAAFGVFILMMQVGIQIGWVSPNIARLTANDSAIPLSMDQASWMVSIQSLGGLVGAVLAALGIEFLGSERTIFACFVFNSLTWACMILASSVLWLYAARIIGGVGLAGSFCCFSMYLGEVAQPRIRGTLITIAAGGNPLGIVVGTVAETYLPMQLSSSIYLVQCLLGLGLFLWLRDSPYHLVKRGKLERARSAVAFYHAGCDADKETEEIKNFIEAHASRNFRDKLRDFNSPTVRKALFLIVTLSALPHLSGTINISSYMEIILNKGKSYLIKPQQFVIYANITSVISTLLTFQLMDKLGRRCLLIVSSIGTTIAMAGLGMHFYLLQRGFDADSLQWLPVLCILGYLITYAVGFSPVPSTVLSELFTDNVKSMAALTATLSSPIFSFIVTKSYQPMVDWVGETYVFWIHAVLSFVATPYALFVLPETKGKTFQEIQSSIIKK